MGDQKSPLGDQEVAVDFLLRTLFAHLTFIGQCTIKLETTLLKTVATDNRSFNNSNFISIISILDTFC